MASHPAIMNDNALPHFTRAVFCRLHQTALSPMGNVGVQGEEERSSRAEYSKIDWDFHFRGFTDLYRAQGGYTRFTLVAC